MSYKDGEKNWFRDCTPAERDGMKRKPWVTSDKSCVSMLADAAAVLAVLPPPPFRVLDAGCADGFLTNILDLCGYLATGMDICDDAIEWARVGYVEWNGLIGRPVFTCGDFDNLPVAMYDAIVFSSTLHHSLDRQKTLASCFNALHARGMLIAIEPGLTHESSRYTKAWANKMNVTERSTPPYAIIRDAKAVGFRKFKVYPNPGTLMKATYLRKLRLPIGPVAVSLAKHFHGMVTMHKP